MKSKHCCERMEWDLSQVCPTHANRADCPDALISFNEKLGRYGLYIHDGGGSVITIAFCPWCGASLAGIAPANLDWTELAVKVGSYTPNDPLTKHGGTGYAQRAISELLGDEFIRDAVDVYLESGHASELARSILRLLLSRTATAYCLALYEEADSTQERRSVLELLRFIADESIIPWLEVFLSDSDRRIRFWGLEITHNYLHVLDRPALTRIVDLIRGMSDLGDESDELHDNMPTYAREIVEYLAEFDDSGDC